MFFREFYKHVSVSLPNSVWNISGSKIEPRPHSTYVNDTDVLFGRWFSTVSKVGDNSTAIELWGTSSQLQRKDEKLC
jgi:hypothetical protein